MENKTIGKGLVVAVLGLVTFGLLAGAPAREINIPFPERSASPDEAEEAADTPRECDLKRGIDTRCTFL